MFERYTEKARRTIFFARYEASMLGSWVIQPDHLLVGLLRENGKVRDLVRVDIQQLSARLRGVSSGERIPTSVDLPLDEESKHVLAHAAEEADSMNHSRIAPEHLLLGIMREKQSHAARMLEEMNAPSLEELRKTIAASEPQEEPPAALPGGLASALAHKFLVIEEGGRALSETLRLFGSLPSMGHRISITTDGVRETYEVIDILWDFRKGGNSMELVLATIEVRVRKAAPPSP
jgi:ATP-dependent Clp protease ATP-binding subunit ClpC